jgi:hypothetical protein
MAYDLVDRIYWYCSQQKTETVNGERTFGWMMDANEHADYVPFAPQEQLLAMSNFNHLMANAELKDVIETSNGRSVMYRFKKADGKDLIVAWTKDGRIPEGLWVNIDEDSAVISDIYGNETEKAITDGRLYIKLSNTPQYIISGTADAGGETDEEPDDETDVDTAYSSISVLNSDGKICISGNQGLESENMTVYVEKDGTLKYLNQIKTDAVGNYEFTFPLHKEYGKYSLTLGTKNNGKIPLEFSFDIEAFEILLTKNGQPVESFEGLAAGDKIKVDFKRNMVVTNSSFVIVAQYDSKGALTAVDSVSAKESKSFEIEVKKNAPGEIKTFVWDMISLNPLEK